MGYHRAFIEAGFDVEITGVDIASQKHYPFRFVQDDALGYAAAHGWSFDFIHASPPCQVHSQVTPDTSNHLDWIPHTRWILEALGKPYVIENVPGARKALRSPIMICGAQLGLKVYRHRYFESNVLLLGMAHMPHHDKTPRAGHGISPKGYLSVTSGGQGIAPEQINVLKKSGASSMHRFISPKGFISVAGHFSQVDYARYAMGIDWMTQVELSQAIPPAYTEYIGRQLSTYFANEARQPDDELDIWSLSYASND